MFIRCSCIFWICPLIQVVVYRIRRIFLPLRVQRQIFCERDFFLVFVGFAGFIRDFVCAPAVKIKVCFFRGRRNNFCAEFSRKRRLVLAVVRVKCQCYDFSVIQDFYDCRAVRRDFFLNKFFCTESGCFLRLCRGLFSGCSCHRVGSCERVAVVCNVLLPVLHFVCCSSSSRPLRIQYYVSGQRDFCLVVIRYACSV